MKHSKHSIVATIANIFYEIHNYQGNKCFSGSCLMFSDKLIWMENHVTLARIINCTHTAFLYITKVTFGGGLDAEHRIISRCCLLVATQDYYRN